MRKEQTSNNGSHSLSSKRLLRLLPNINIAREFRPSALVHDVGVDLGISNDGRVLLAWTNVCAVARDGRVDFETYACGGSFRA